MDAARRMTSREIRPKRTGSPLPRNLLEKVHNPRVTEGIAVKGSTSGPSSGSLGAAKPNKKVADAPIIIRRWVAYSGSGIRRRGFQPPVSCRGRRSTQAGNVVAPAQGLPARGINFAGESVMVTLTDKRRLRP